MPSMTKELPDVQALGRERIEMLERAQSVEERRELWKKPLHPFPFKWGDCWKQCMEYKVDDFHAEVGFFVDILGMGVNALGEEYAMFIDASESFTFAVVPAKEGDATPTDAIRLQFMIQDIDKVTAELEERGIVFEKRPEPTHEGSRMVTGWFRTPNGIAIDLWGMIEVPEENIPAA